MFSARVQRSAVPAVKEGPEPSTARSVREALASPSTELDPATRAFMEPRLGHDFSKVRIHAAEPAAGSARELSARAYTAGQRVVFAAGEYAPGTQAGRRLLAHELTHVVQQAAGSVGGRAVGGVRLSQPEDRFEREAECVARNLDAIRPAIRLTGVDARPTSQRRQHGSPDAEQLQRALKVHTQDIESGALRAAIEASRDPAIAPLKGVLKQAVSAANTAGVQSTDVPAMAQSIILQMPAAKRPPAPKLPAFTAALEGVIGGLGLSGFNVGTPAGAKEGGAFMKLIGIAGQGASRAKATPNTLGVGVLPAKLATAVTAALVTVAAVTGEMALAVSVADAYDSIDSRVRQGLLRMAHLNIGGWLPAVGVPAVPATHAQGAWDQFTASQSAYVEYTVAPAEGVEGWRIVHDYVNNLNYLTLHYHWHEGYNPFFTL